jgi:hypothetical protein
LNPLYTKNQKKGRSFYKSGKIYGIFCIKEEYLEKTYISKLEDCDISTIVYLFGRRAGIAVFSYGGNHHGTQYTGNQAADAAKCMESRNGVFVCFGAGICKF